MKIRKLSDKIINQISAGEIIERPAIAIKELIENSLDAESKCIETVIAGGGKSFFQITDNGFGIVSEEMPMAVKRHCTSKILDDFSNIRTLGFRGEALPSIGSVSNLTLMSRPYHNDTGAQITVSGETISPVRPVAMNPGTIVEVRDLFFTIPARLNFLKSEQIETNLITDVIKRMAIAYPTVRFTFSTIKSNRCKIDFKSTNGDFSKRISQVIGEDFINNAVEINEKSNEIKLKGYTGIPTFNRGNTSQLYFFVNGRIIHDKFILSTIRMAYAETIPLGRYPVAVLLLEIEPRQIDVNVHPAKYDIRFRNPKIVRNLIIQSIQKAINKKVISTSSIISNKMIASFHQNNSEQIHPYKHEDSLHTNNQEKFFLQNKDIDIKYLVPKDNITYLLDNDPVEENDKSQYQLGIACAQIHQNYIISQTSDALVIVDQHAAHERIVFEKMRKDFYNENIPSQTLLIPEIIDLLEEECTLIIEHHENLRRLGITVERFGPNAIVVREIPAILSKNNILKLLRDIVDEIIDNNTTHNVTDKMEKILATIACYGSIRSGRKMQYTEMNQLLREMEKSTNSSQCNHGRPTFIKLQLSDIEKLFGR
ncbi:DNA mismatch repair endonuclease MutL [Candidatus Liberibacter africanus]|uniref:DNA mismatch repair protein MutL n=1 Tax=Candidatus Liberibacter africanus PTSAPSY TaxID=1277257 RepID=A0A0G3I8B2_LIBAF|nr:DNA mismatch repair endonuclease MutL [Candidatus Liberibacter africanus]AKK19952.1 DNA mismatch repair protein [Candidatus Liberibacter africanus PTSAPSY]QTP63790.1 DNA mismatch repair endonuclease MutL [Candidatus Liberibacter africanus]